MPKKIKTILSCHCKKGKSRIMSVILEDCICQIKKGKKIRTIEVKKIDGNTTKELR